MKRRHPWTGDHGLPLLALVVTATALSFFRIRSTDIFWHLAAGRWIFDHGSLPRLDPFRFTSNAAPWIDHEWLFQVIVHSFERLAGLQSLVPFRALLVNAIALLLYRTARRAGLRTYAATTIAAISLFGIRPRMILRPELLSFIALLLLLELLARFSTANRGQFAKPLVAMMGLTIVWANVHGVVLLAPVVAGLYLFGARLDRPVPAFPSWAVLAMPLGLLAAILLNPYGYHVLLVSRGISSAMKGLPGTNAEWAPQWLAPQPYFLFALVAVAGLAVLGRVRTGRIHVATGLVAAAFAVLATTAVRHQALFFLAATPFVARTLAGLLKVDRPSPKLFSRVRFIPFATCALIVLWTALPPTRGWLRPRQGAFTPGFGIEPGRFPVRAADFLERHPEIGPLYNTFAHGGYLMWRFYASRQVFHDGRMELIPGLLRQIGEARADGRAWEELMNRHGVDGALVRYEERLRPVLGMDDEGKMVLTGHRTPNGLLFPREIYSLVYWDDEAMLLLRRTPERSAWLMEHEYRALDPEDLRWTIQRAAQSLSAASTALRETQRKLVEDPHNRRAQLLYREILNVRQKLLDDQRPAVGHTLTLPTP